MCHFWILDSSRDSNGIRLNFEIFTFKILSIKASFTPELGSPKNFSISFNLWQDKVKRYCLDNFSFTDLLAKGENWDWLSKLDCCWSLLVRLVCCWEAMLWYCWTWPGKYCWCAKLGCSWDLLNKLECCWNWLATGCWNWVGKSVWLALECCKKRGVE